MDFEWDEAKSKACFVERGFDFAYVVQAFFDPHRLNREDLRRNYGEERYKLMGRIESRVFVVVYTQRSKTIRIISARKANNREINQYENSSHQN